MIKTKKKFAIKEGARIPKAKADIYGNYLTELSEKIGLTASNLVEDAKLKSSPVHDYFEWNNEKAADEYRLEQARLLIRSIVIWDEKTEDCHRAFLMVNQEDIDSNSNDVYVPIQEILDSKDMTEQVLKEALEYLKWFRKKYAMLKELAKVHKVIDELEN